MHYKKDTKITYITAVFALHAMVTKQMAKLRHSCLQDLTFVF